MTSSSTISADEQSNAPSSTALASSEASVRCAICARTITANSELWAPTSDGAAVHVDCADRQARLAYWLRALRAAISAAVVLGVLLLARRSAQWEPRLVLGAAARAALHVLLNFHWWRLTAAPLVWRLQRTRRRTQD
jgi:hypothetical protein